MKTPKFLTTILVCLTMLMSYQVSAQDFPGLDKSPMDAASFPDDYKNANKLIKVVYSRPQLKDRSLDKLAPNGKVWRTGANEAAELSVYVPMSLDGTMIKPGTYTLFTIPGEKEWTVILSSDLNVWGSYFYNEKNDVARITVPVTNAEKPLEAFAMKFTPSEEGVHLNMGWGNVRIAVPFKAE
ncbi:MAG: DUF2911 domain-containing protein [Winogradskyella sp.]|nr:DUF2911 domain-containing protein [Winogradskyella sp.]NNL82897.1 DUF2911 domain-containing protein [Winogradskyella sp.]